MKQRIQIEITHLPNKKQHILYILRVYEESGTSECWGTYNCNKDELKLYSIHFNPLVKYTSLIVEYLKDSEVRKSGRSFIVVENV